MKRYDWSITTGHYGAKEGNWVRWDDVVTCFNDGYKEGYDLGKGIIRQLKNTGCSPNIIKGREMTFEELYRCYVIREAGGGGAFVGENAQMYRVTRRDIAARFTRKEAMEYIKTGSFCKEGSFVIEDAK